MAGRCFTRPQARIFGILLDRPVQRRSTRLSPCHRKSPASFLPSSQWCLPAETSIRCLILATTISSSPKTPAASTTTEQLLVKELSKAASVVECDALPREEAIQNALQICENLAKALTEPVDPPNGPLRPGQSPTSNLLSLEQETRGSHEPPPHKAQSAGPIEAQIAESISTTAYRIITDPKVFISPTLLSTYVSTQTILGRPQSFPQVFDLYAMKPRPQPGTNAITYKESNPNRASSAVPFSVASSALNAAIEMKTLSLCLDIIDATVCTIAYKRNKIIRKALLPATGLALAPAAAYVLATKLAEMQYSMDNQMATQMFFAGIVAYVGFTATIGVVAITTSNDQMDRITWAKGTPLTDRWLREDERALVDRVAGAWGFEDVTMRGEEEGVEWETLREWAGRRAMILDNPELMEGME